VPMARGETELTPMSRSGGRIPPLGPPLFAMALLALVAAYAVPRAVAAFAGLDDPAKAASQALDGTFNEPTAKREIEAALAANDPDLAQSIVDLAIARQVTIDAALVQKVQAAVAETATTRHQVQSFARGFVTGTPDDVAGFAGTTVGDLLVFGDIRDALREGKRLAAGEQADELVLGLACVGIAITAGTYATLGAAAPARVGLTLAKVARKTGNLSAEFAANLGRMLRAAVDERPLREAATTVSFAEPTLARAARDAVKVERAGGLVQVTRDIVRVGSAAGGRAALDGLKIAKDPREVARLAKLAEKEGGRTRAILKIAGRAAIAVGAFALDAALWLLSALFAVFGFVSALKNATERMALRYFRRRRERRRAKALRPFAAATPCD